MQKLYSFANKSAPKYTSQLKLEKQFTAKEKGIRSAHYP